MRPPRSSRQRYQNFVEEYRAGTLDQRIDAEKEGAGPRREPGKRREYLKDYLKWLWPHRWATAAVFTLALAAAGLEMVSPLFMRSIIDKVLLATALDPATRMGRLNLIGGLFLLATIVSNLLGAWKDYRQRILNVKVILALRRALFRRLLHLPLPRLWEMKTGGLLSRLTGDVETTTGLLQMAIVSPAISLLRLIIAIGILTALNWRLALMALAVVPGVITISFIATRRIRPIYRSVRKDVEEIDGRVGETFGGIRVVRAFRREL
ncbi:MAG TPA: ABC transporter ATP-binding protein, partial [Gemmatimonadales bacterium]|nr:ABC transporter ATP-binding protein [Gemmatimonadales bacterium]